ncbi:MAG: hypothetical protein II426_07265 [Methanobrevibacter sp.]|nr:hypothetical protein [Methanobrevibacter sp.]MBQ2352811.1 hypothetical protein [Methanobrevibacter sp.]
MARKGLGKGLDSLIPNFYDEDFDSNSTQSLEDMLNDVSEEEPTEEVEVQEEETVEVEIEDEGSDDEEEETGEGDGSSEDLSGDSSSEETVQTSQEIEIQEEHVDEVKQIVEKNPRITLWSSRSSAVFRYLRKTEPEFSISKEASVLIEEAVAKKYPEIWALFEDL